MGRPRPGLPLALGSGKGGGILEYYSVLLVAGFRNPGYEIILKLAPHAVNASWEGTSESREMYDTSGNSIGPYSKSHGRHAWAYGS